MVNNHLRSCRSFTEFVVCGNFLAEVNLVEFFCTKNFLYDRKLEQQKNGSLREINHMLVFEIPTYLVFSQGKVGFDDVTERH